MFIVFAIIGLARVREVMELRDRYRHALAPGAGNRETCAAVYSFQQEVAAISGFDWPDDAFEDLDIQGDDDDGELNHVRRSDHETRAEAVVAKLESMVADAARREEEASEAARNPVQLFAVHCAELPSFGISRNEKRFVRSEVASDDVYKPFRLTLHVKGSRGVWFALFRDEKPDDTLLKLLSSLRPEEPGRVVLGLPGNLKHLKEPLAALLGEAYSNIEVLQGANARLPFSQWPDRLLEDLEVELALVQERNVTVSELRTILGKVWRHIEFADPKDEQTAQERAHRIRLWALSVLSMRGRWIGEIPGPKSTAMSAPSRALHQDPVDAAKQRRRLSELVADGETSRFGEQMHEVVTAVQRWLAAPGSVSTLPNEVAEMAIQLHLANPPTAIHQRDVRLTLTDYLGTYSQGTALLEGAVLSRLRSPIPSSWLRAQRTDRQTHYFGGSPRHESAPGFVQGFWCNVQSASTEFGRVTQFRSTRFGGSRHKDPISGSLAEGVEINVGASLVSPHANPTMFPIWSSLADLLSNGYEGKDAAPAKKEAWFTKDSEDSDPHLYVAVTIAAPSMKALDLAKTHWPAIAAHLSEIAIEPLHKVGLPGHLTFAPALEPFLDFFIRMDAWRTLLLGGIWTQPEQPNSPPVSGTDPIEAN